MEADAGGMSACDPSLGSDSLSAENILADTALTAGAEEGTLMINPGFSFKDFATEHGLHEFAALLVDAGLTDFIDNCDTALTIFAPTDEAIMRLGEQLPADNQLLRELLCVHITMGSLR